MPSPTLGRVFISSVFGGMMDLRELAGEMTRHIGLEPVLAEQIPANPESVRSKLQSLIEGCDTYVGVFDTRRGTVPEGQDAETARAITEQELLYARELGLRPIVFLSDAEEREPGLQEFLDAEVTDYETGVWSGYYDSPDRLATGIVASLALARPRLRLTLEGGQATLDLSGTMPVWTGPETLTADVDLHLSPAADAILQVFLEGTPGKTASEDDLRILGAELFENAFPAELGQAVGELLGKSQGRLMLLEVQADEPEARYLPWELIRVGNKSPVREGNLEVVRRLGDASYTPKIPGDHLSVLGFTASPFEDRLQRIELGVEGGHQTDSELFWEQEQEMLMNALAPLISEQRARLVLPDEGSQNRLREELERKDRPRILHVSCHGGPNERGEPALYLEDDEARRAATTAEDLLGWYRSTPGAEPVDLAVLSSCYTAARKPGAVGGPDRRATAVAVPEGTQVAGLAEDLAMGGIARTLGMQTSVSDRGATAFAARFYELLSEGIDLPCALRAGRQALTAAGLPHEWAIPVLLSTGDVGPLVSPRRQQASVDDALVSSRESTWALGAEKYLIEGYAGRRDFERRLSRAVAQENTRPIAIHGLGGLGKSTLAIRFLQRRKGAGEHVWALSLEERLAPEALEAAVLQKLGIKRPAGVSEEQARQAVQIETRQVLREQRCHLLLDNFEDQQNKDDGSWLDEETGRLLRDLKQLGGPDFNLLVTTRLELPDALNLDLGELPSSALRKFRLQRPSLERLQDEEWDLAVEHLGGHPKALEILAGYLQDHPERVRTLVKRFERVSEHIAGELSREDQDRGRKLLIKEVLADVPEDRRPTFDRLCLLRAPLPTEELLDLLEAEDIETADDDLTWLRQRGLLARVAPSALLGGDMVHRLVAVPWKGALAQREGDEVEQAWHRRMAEHLDQPGKPLPNFGIAAQHLAAAGDRAGAMKVYNRWALQLRDGHAYRASEQVAREGLQRFGKPFGATRESGRC